MSEGGIVVVVVVIAIVLGAIYLSNREGQGTQRGTPNGRSRSTSDAGMYGAAGYAMASDTGTRDGRGDGGGFVDPTPDAGSGDHGGGMGDSGGDGGGDGGGGGGDG